MTNAQAEKKYICTEDLQQTGWYVGESFTAKEWLEHMIMWMEWDDVFETDSERENCTSYWNAKIEAGEENELILHIADLWELKIEEDTAT